MAEPQARITVLKRYLNQDLIDGYLGESHRGMKECNVFREGDEYLVTDLFNPPEGFCHWAWADIRKDVWLVASGGSMPIIKYPNTMISGCTDWFRPVVFRIERATREGNDKVEV